RSQPVRNLNTEGRTPTSAFLSKNVLKAPNHSYDAADEQLTPRRTLKVRPTSAITTQKERRGLPPRSAGGGRPTSQMAEHFNPDADLNTPSIARMYDYLLGGKDNFEVDRKACNVLLERIPELLDLANGNRSFLSRAVSYVASQGVEQFLDLGAGLPTADNTHHVAQKANPRARVVYVDHDPIVLAHGRALLSNTPETAFLLADIREPEQILNSSQTRRLIDPELPVCVMLVSLLHCIPDGEAFPLAHELISSLPSGSYVIYSHIVS